MNERIMYLLDKVMELEKELKDKAYWEKVRNENIAEQKEENIQLINENTSLKLKIQDLENNEKVVF